MHLANPSIHILLSEILKVQGQPPLFITPDNLECNVSYPLDGGKALFTLKIDWYGTGPTSKPVGAEVIKLSTLGSDLISNDEFRTHDPSSKKLRFWISTAIPPCRQENYVFWMVAMLCFEPIWLGEPGVVDTSFLGNGCYCCCSRGAPMLLSEFNLAKKKNGTLWDWLEETNLSFAQTRVVNGMWLFFFVVRQ